MKDDIQEIKELIQVLEALKENSIAVDILGYEPEILDQQIEILQSRLSDIE